MTTNWYKIFYWLTVADNAKTFFWIFAVIFTIFAIISTIIFISSRDSETLRPDYHSTWESRSKKWMWWSYPFMMLLWACIVFTPSKKDSLLILAGGGSMQFLTTDSTARQLPHELSNFVLSELRSMSKEAGVNLGIMEQKEKLIDEAKKMTASEIIEKMKVDSTFAKVILDK
jgi:hypothetical protein